ncbi:MAG: hypothetical protein ABI193_12695 [Minicystis sp.]
MAEAAGARTSASPVEWGAYVLAIVPGTLLALLGASGLVSEVVVLALFSLSYVGLNLAHMAATWTRVYADPGAWRGMRFERVVMPLLLIVGAMSAEALGFAAVLISAQYFLSVHHALMENYGVVRFTQARAGRRLDSRLCRLTQAACFLLPFAALVHRARVVATDFRGISLLSAPAWLAPSMAALGAIALVAYVAIELRARAKGEPVALLGVAVVVVTNLLWSWLFVAIHHPLLPLYAIASAHYVQHLHFVWRFEHRAGALGAVPVSLRERVAPPRRFAYLAALGALGAAVLVILTGATVGARWLAEALAIHRGGPSILPPWTAAMIGVNFSHYWLDHRVWRLRRPEVARPLDLAGVAA